MIIIENDFKIEEGSSPARYDLYLKKIINKGKKDTSGKSLEREDWILEGYDISINDKPIISLTIEELEAINYLIKSLDYGIE